jgi:hypothetical protein
VVIGAIDSPDYMDTGERHANHFNNSKVYLDHDVEAME